MRIEIEIPDKDIPQRQDSIDIHMSFIDGKVCGCDYPFATIVEEEKTKADALDKIRAEIKTKYDSIPWRDNDYDDGWIEALEWVYDDIIGKYKESEK